MDCKEAQILFAPHIMSDLEHGPGLYSQLEAHLLSCRACRESKYDVIERTESDVGIRRSYRFNKKTEMLDFIVEVKLDHKKDAPFYGATFIDYYKHNGINYPKRSISYGLDYQIRTEKDITNFVINGVAVP